MTKQKLFHEKLPILTARIADGTIVRDGGSYVGHSAQVNGIRCDVQIGYVGGEDFVEKYLAVFPEPKDW